MKANLTTRTTKAFVLATALFAAVAAQYVLGNASGPFWGFPNESCAAPSIGSVTHSMYFSSAVKSYIDASNPQLGCIRHTDY